MKSLDEKIKAFLSSKAYGVAGASNNRSKYGNKVLRVYKQNQKTVYPVHPTESIIEDLESVRSVEQLPEEVRSLSIITPPPITERIVEAAIKKGIKNIWMQPGAESQKAVEMCEKSNINVISGGPCILVELRFHDT